MAPARDKSGFHLNEEAFNDTAADLSLIHI